MFQLPILKTSRHPVFHVGVLQPHWCPVGGAPIPEQSTAGTCDASVFALGALLGFSSRSTRRASASVGVYRSVSKHGWQSQRNWKQQAYAELILEFLSVCL